MRPASSYPHCDAHVAFTPRRPPRDSVLRIALDMIVAAIVCTLCFGAYVLVNEPDRAPAPAAPALIHIAQESAR